MDENGDHELFYNKVESMNGDTQKCWLDPSVMKKLNCAVGSCIEILQPNNTFLCSVWPYDYSQDCSMVKFEDSVSQEAHSADFRIKALSSVKATSLSVDIIVQDYKKFHLWNTSENVLKNLQIKCLKCLRNFYVKDNFRVDLKSSYLARLFGIKSIVINKIHEKCEDSVVNIHNKTIIEISSVVSKERFDLLQKKPSVKLGGVRHIVNELNELIILPLTQNSDLKKLNLTSPRVILLRGPAGCGKTSILKIIAYDCKAALVTLNGHEVLGSRPGETENNIQQVFEKTKNLSLEGPCILFIDELDSLCPKRSSGSSHESRGTSAVISCLDEVCDIDNMIIIGATNRPSAIDLSLRRPGRFEREILVNVPNRQERGDILKVLLEDLPAWHIDIELLSSITNGYVGADLKSLCNEAAFCAMNRNSDSKAAVIEMCDFNEAIKRVIPCLTKGTEGLVDIKPVLWTDIGGLEDIKQQIQQSVEWPMLHPEAFERFGLPVSKGVLLYGPPGCCKTTLVRAAATSTHTTFISLNGAQLFSPFVGESERIVAETFQKARSLAPSIIFLDELDSIVGKRAGSTRGVQERLLSTLLNEMDGIGVRLDDKVYSTGNEKLAEGNTNQQQDLSRSKVKVDNSRVLVVAATNRPDLVDSALLRPGRLDRIIYVPPPDNQARLEILKICCHKIPIKDVNLTELADKTEFYTGADLASLCREAAMCAMSESLESTSVLTGHFKSALELVKPSLNETLIQKYQQLHFKT